MALLAGTYDATIKSHGIGQTQKGTGFICLTLAIKDNEVPCYIYLSEKAMGMARAALKKCGFDIDEHELKVLRDKPDFLKGRIVQVEYEEDEQYGARAQIVLSRMTNEHLDELTANLRSVKKKTSESKNNDDGDLPF